MFESENRKSSNQNRESEIGIIEAEIRIEATQLTRRIVTALLRTVKSLSCEIQIDSQWCLDISLCAVWVPGYAFFELIVVVPATMVGSRRNRSQPTGLSTHQILIDA